MSLRVIKPEKIRQMRGSRSLREVAEASGAFTHGALWQWESSRHRVQPTFENVKTLINVLGCTYDDISEPVEADQ